MPLSHCLPCRSAWLGTTNLQMAFLRPLATLSQYVDYLLWPTHPALMHLHNILLYMGIVTVAAHLYRRLLPGPWCAGLATLLYAIDDAHALGVAWIASRNTLLTALFCLLCLALYVRSRESRSPIAAGPLQSRFCSDTRVVKAQSRSGGTCSRTQFSLIPERSFVACGLFFRLQSSVSGG